MTLSEIEPSELLSEAAGDFGGSFAAWSQRSSPSPWLAESIAGISSRAS